jgi:hypothetical protein
MPSTSFAMADGPSLSVAIGGALATVSRIVNELQDFLSGVGDVDEAVKTFVNSIKNLETVLKTIQKSLHEESRILTNNAEIKRINAALDYILSDCQHTASSFDTILRKLGKRGLSEYQATLGQLRVGQCAHEITKIRWHISIYRDSFQAYLLAIRT